MSNEAKCELCGEPMPLGEEMFKYHGYSGPCPKPVVLRSPEGEWVSNGRMREIWAECGGLVDRHGRPYVENRTAQRRQHGGQDRKGTTMSKDVREAAERRHADFVNEAIEEARELLDGKAACNVEIWDNTLRMVLGELDRLRTYLSREADGWRPIESATKDGGPFLGAYRRFCGRGDPWMFFVFRANTHEMRFETVPKRAARAHRQPTHWQPLPTPPTEEGKERS